MHVVDERKCCSVGQCFVRLLASCETQHKIARNAFRGLCDSKKINGVHINVSGAVLTTSACWSSKDYFMNQLVICWLLLVALMMAVMKI